jgi:hypothetical protein
MVTRITLGSGNEFYHSQGNSEKVSVAMVVTPENKFIGGFAGKEADRKLKAFTDYTVMKNVTIVPLKKINTYRNVVISRHGYSETVQVKVETEVPHTFPNIKDLDTSMFCKWIGTASGLFAFHPLFDLVDKHHASRASACDERRYYFKAVGLEKLMDSYISCPMWALIANHLSIFGKEQFRETFFKGLDMNTAQSDMCVHTKITRYSNNDFKAPAYYLRKAVQE